MGGVEASNHCCEGSQEVEQLRCSDVSLVQGDVEVSLDPCAPGQKSGSGGAVGAVGEAPASETSAGGEDIADISKMKYKCS